jgi:gliding motility-associated protein GldM
MSGGKETPRQKMIGMMYLVLTALLALNVSKEILNAFVIVEDGLNKTNENFDGKNSVLYAKFEKAMTDNKTKTKPFYDKALIIKKRSEELCKMIDDIKSELYLEVQKLPSKEVADTFKLKQLDSKDNYDTPTHYLLGATPETPGADAHIMPLKEEIIKFRKELIEAVPEKERVNLKLGLVTEDTRDDEGKTVSWEFNNFDHTTMAATMCILAGIKNDIKNAESDVVGVLLKAIDANDFKFDAIEAKVVAPTSYIVSGEKYVADIFVSAHSSTQNPEIIIGQIDTTNKLMPKIVGTGTPVTVVNGVGKYEVSTGSEGVQEYNGVINVKAPDGSVKPYRFHGEYMVARPSMAISPTKMNVFYIGVENPVDISVAGAAPTDVVANLSGAQGSISSSGQGHYIVKVTGGTKCDINVSVKSKSGTSKSMGKMEFRIKKVPSPLASFAGITGDGSASKGELGAAGGVIPKLEDFVFDLKFPVISWVLSMNINGVFVDEPAQGPNKTAKMNDMLSRAKPGTKILIEQVKVQAPGEVRKIPGCVIKVK